MTSIITAPRAIHTFFSDLTRLDGKSLRIRLLLYHLFLLRCRKKGKTYRNEKLRTETTVVWPAGYGLSISYGIPGKIFRNIMIKKEKPHQAVSIPRQKKPGRILRLGRPLGGIRRNPSRFRVRGGNFFRKVHLTKPITLPVCFFVVMCRFRFSAMNLAMVSGWGCVHPGGAYPWGGWEM